MEDEDEDERRRLLPTPTPPSDWKASLRRRSSNCLPPFHEDFPLSEEPSSAVAIWTVVPILLLGVFVANADGSLVIASSQHIASEFQALNNASWLVTSYVLAQCASQSLYGKLSDIFGRRSNLVAAYTLFTAGCFLCGIAKDYWHILAGRAISGLGGAGMTALVSIVIADMVSVRNVAAWRSYVNVAATVGRSLGGPIGGWLTDTIGWRWSFFGQCPLTLVGLLLILWKLPTKTKKIDSEEEDSSFSSKIKRVDFIGAIVLASTISALLLALDFATKEGPWWRALISTLLFLFLAVIFWAVERFYAKEPILPIELVTNRDTITPYLVVGVQTAAQFGLFYSVPIYFQIAAHTSVTQAGLRLVPAVVGNAIGGLLSGHIISSTGRYKHLTTFASASASVGYLLILIRWRGETSWAEVLYIFFGGFGMGIIQSTTFIHLAASLDQSEIAIAGTALYLAQNLFVLVGIQLATAILHSRLNATLSRGLEGIKHKSEIMEQAISSVDFIWALPENIRRIVIRCYVDSLTYTYGQSFVFAFIGLLIGLTIKEQEL